MHNEALSAQREPWISHTDVNLKMRKKRVMVPLGSDGLFHASVEEEKITHVEQMFFFFFS